ncbi:MAG: glycosyltransferase family 2 protein [Kiritimatiellae bacterium]|nr:glycosyltransferase family 2 protein [Kiritimatiellia bacterium]
MNCPTLAIVAPCYNEAAALPNTAPAFMAKLRSLKASGAVGADSFIMFVDDGSGDDTWEVIKSLHAGDPAFKGVSLSRNRGHQNALLAGLMEAKQTADVVISADCDGQDDIEAMDAMLAEHAKGAEIVYACRDNRETDTWFKRTTAELFYKLVRKLGGEVVFNHADYRLATARVLTELERFGEVNLFLRGMFPLVGFKSAKVYYTRKERVSGESHYPLAKMAGFAADGITSLSIRPLRLITLFGAVVSLLAFVMLAWVVVSYIRGTVVPGWSSSVVCVCLFGGIQLVSLGVIGEYVGKTYLESKRRPRYIIGERI